MAAWIARGCSQSSQPDDSACEMNERQEGRGEFVVARGNASELLDATEETLDQIMLEGIASGAATWADVWQGRRPGPPAHRGS